MNKMKRKEEAKWIACVSNLGEFTLIWWGDIFFVRFVFFSSFDWNQSVKSHLNFESKRPKQQNKKQQNKRS